ncbi:hypothetical protein GWK91_05000 [Virgibacillus sp. MSP4-1]|uniref:hypothetical protein n=1 Tax=Virgibacillus sp. MSP4-1 TaxID=2700081 RepID=UPI0005C4B9B9|nr:hypothetical protein [Virgibacillus sp. MSP4-1]QHS22349.1 hypothetical protein GWK91_05000 [Virgibacillus sp. MSP4-1]
MNIKTSIAGYLLGLTCFGTGEIYCSVQLQGQEFFPFSWDLRMMMMNYIDLFITYITVTILLQWNALKMTRQIIRSRTLSLCSMSLSLLLFSLFCFSFPGVVMMKFTYYITLGSYDIFTITSVLLVSLSFVELIRHLFGMEL